MRKDAQELEFTVLADIRDPSNSNKIIHSQGEVLTLWCSRTGIPLEYANRERVRDGFLGAPEVEPTEEVMEATPELEESE
ncbi:hypothetical protein LCGC14_0615810 [marine sediment metagenome]|uniref:Uncharacterized protein n=1 Tax=marine sediment metagenome TaxID=412755 RepID=A0A0F9RQI4_9ZZZZ